MPGWTSNTQGSRSRGAPTSIARRILDRDRGQCQVGSPRCTTIATEVDHIIPVFEGGTDDPHNLQAICSPCHRMKTNQEASRARARRLAPVWQRPHPGLL